MVWSQERYRKNCCTGDRLSAVTNKWHIGLGALAVVDDIKPIIFALLFGGCLALNQISSFPLVVNLPRAVRKRLLAAQE